MDSKPWTLAPLSAQQAQQARDTGYVAVRGLIDAKKVDDIRAWTEEVLAWPEESGRHWVFHEASLQDKSRSLVSRVERIAPFHPGFAALADALAPHAAAILGGPAVLFKEKIQCKFPGAEGFTPHQDAQAGWDRYADLFITAMVSIDDCSADNGCIEMADTKFERNDLRQSWEPLSDAQLAGVTFTPIPTQPGDVLLFDSLIPHRSEPNLSNRKRWVYYATYNRASFGDQSGPYYEAKHKSYPPDIDRLKGREYVFRV